MTELLIYQGKTAIALAAFYIFYRLLLSKETFHRFNRIVLLGTAALSFILPLCVITINKVVTLPYASVSLEMPESIAETMTVTAETATEPIWSAILCGIFTLGAVAVLLMTVISIFKVRAIIRNGEHRTLDSGETLVITDDGTAPFSWMKYIVLSREDYEDNPTQILTHEKAHISLRHSWDLLFVDLITTLQWFNPAIWMLKADLRALHEFEADDAVLRSGANIKEYQYLLIRKAVGKSGYSVANSLNHSTLKQRITMMLNKKSSRMSAWKALYVIPLVGISLAATAETKVDYRFEDREPGTVADTHDHKGSENWRKKNLHEGKIIVDYENSTLTVIYYGNNEKECQVQFAGIALNQDIYIHNGAIVTKGMADKAAEDPEAVMMTSYLKDGKKVMAIVTPSGTYMTGKVQIVQEKKQEKDPVPFQHLGQQPGFNGGDANEFSKWVYSQLQYPEECRKAGIAGRVSISFTVGTDGKVTDVQILRGVHEKLDAEAVRVIGMSPEWTPGTEDGKPVPVRFVFPVTFEIPQDNG